MSRRTPPQSQRASALHWYCCVLVAATLLLIAAGGIVTSTGSGLSVPDWPTTYGYSMVTFPLDRMSGGVLYEHGHRLIATAVGLMTIGLVIWLRRAEPRPWVRRLGAAALGAVVLQGALGGITVLYLLPDAVSISHAGLAQIFFCLLVTLAVATGPTFDIAPPDDPRSSRLGRRALAVTAAIYVQILLGAATRHMGAGLAISDFPLVFGGLAPPAWTPLVTVHYLHRLGAVIVAVVVVLHATDVFRDHRQRPELVRLARLLSLLLAAQIALGGTVVLLEREPIVNTLHVVTGATLLGTSLTLALRARSGRPAAPGPETAWSDRQMAVGP